MSRLGSSTVAIRSDFAACPLPSGTSWSRCPSSGTLSIRRAGRWSRVRPSLSRLANAPVVYIASRLSIVFANAWCMCVTVCCAADRAAGFGPALSPRPSATASSARRLPSTCPMVRSLPLLRRSRPRTLRDRPALPARLGRLAQEQDRRRRLRLPHDGADGLRCVTVARLD